MFLLLQMAPCFNYVGSEREARRQEEEERTCSCLFAGCSVSNDLAPAPHLRSGGGFGFELLSTLPKCILLPSEGPAAARQCPPQLPGLPPPSSLVISSRGSMILLRTLVPALWDALLSFGSDNSHFSLLFLQPTGGRGQFFHLDYLLSSNACFTSSLHSTLSVEITRAVSDFLNLTRLTYLVIPVCPTNIIFHVCHDSEKVWEALPSPPTRTQAAAHRQYRVHFTNMHTQENNRKIRVERGACGHLMVLDACLCPPGTGHTDQP